MSGHQPNSVPPAVEERVGVPSVVDEQAFLCRTAQCLQLKSGPFAVVERTVCSRRAVCPLSSNVPSAAKSGLFASPRAPSAVIVQFVASLDAVDGRPTTPLYIC